MVATIAVGLGVDAATAGTIAAVVTPALEGAGLGAITSEVTGGKPLQGALTGGLTGGGIGLGGEFLGPAIGGAGSATIGEALGGAAGGALGGAITGQNPLVSAAEGGISGGIAANLSGAPAGTPSAGAVGGPSAGTSAAPSGVGTGGGDIFASSDTLYPSSTPSGTTAFNPATQLNTGTDLGTITSQLTSGSPQTSTANLGTGTVGTQNLGGFNPTQLANYNAANTADLTGSNFASPTGTPSTPSGLPWQTAGTPAANNLSFDAANAFASANADAAGQQFSGGPGFVQQAINSLTPSGGLSGILGPNASPLGVGATGLALGADLLKAENVSKGERQLEAEAGQLNSQGQALEGYLQSGTLPAGLQAGLNQAADAAKASILSQFAAQGLSGSSAEQEALSQVDLNVQAQSAQIAQQLLTTGISETGQASQLYEQLLQNTLSQDQNLSSAIANFAGAASGAGPQVNLAQLLAKGGNANATI